MRQSGNMNSLKFYKELSRKIIENKEFIMDYDDLLIGNRLEIRANMYKRLLESASIFACSDDETHKIIALKIASKIIETKESGGAFKAACQLIFARLGIFPTFKMAVEQYKIEDYFNILGGKLKENMTFSLKTEILKKLDSNFYNIGQETVLLTDYQVELLQNLKKKSNVSISAPTSAGKSYILTRYIVECLINNDEFIAVYIVPTRALITQVQRDFKKALRDHHVKDVELFTASWEIKDEKQLSKAILILTQERLQALEGRVDNPFKINLLIIDEAQNIEGGARGILLEDSIQQVREWNTNVQVVFIAPFIENPEVFQHIFPSSKLKPIETKFSPVSQNIIFIDIRGKNLERSYISQELGRKIKLDELKIEEKVPENYKRKAWVAANLVEDGPTMVYCNGPGDCKKTANALLDFTSMRDVSQNVSEVIKFLEENVHPNYYLINHLRKGIGYHYGKMPPTIRLVMELLFSRKDIDVICCTSTLMEGINLPAKNIVVYKPKYGNRTITDLDLMNLVGRAGRLMRDFFGNIYCVDNDEWVGPRLGTERTTYEIESSMESVIINKREKIIDNLRMNLKSRSKNDDVEAAVTRFLINEIRKGKIEIIEQLIAQDKSVASSLEEIHTYVKTIVLEVDLPAEIILRNRSIDPRLQNKLYKKLKEIQSPPILRHPAKGNIYADLEKILPLLNECFNKESHDKYTKYHALFANWWVNEKTLRQIIDISLDYIRKKDNSVDLNEELINKEIENIFDTANIKMKFELCRDIGCYIDILQYVLGNDLLDIDEVTNMSFYIEMGAFKPTTLALMNEGFTRTAAILISRKMPQNFKDYEQCRKFILDNIKELNKYIPPILIQEFIC